MVFQTQMPISLVILVIGIQDLYTSKYKYTINMVRVPYMYKTAQNYKYNNIIIVIDTMYNVGFTQKREGIFQEQPVHSLQLTEQQCKQLETFLLSQDKRAYTHAHYNYYHTHT